MPPPMKRLVLCTLFVGKTIKYCKSQDNYVEVETRRIIARVSKKIRQKKQKEKKKHRGKLYTVNN